MKSALVHYWLVGKRGGEVVLEAMGEVLPDADLFAHVIRPEVLFGALRGRKLTTTFISRLPFAQSRYQIYLALMPLALEVLDVNSYDLIVSSEAGPAKWIIPAPNARHICYCHSPLRYIWDQREVYFRQLPALIRPLAHAMASSLRRSDALSANRVDQFIANSTFVRNRIWKYYRRDSEIIHPPIDVQQYTIGTGGDYYLIAGEHRRYKCMDLAIKACTALGRKLIVANHAPDLRSIAGPTVQFVGRPDDAEFRKLLAGCRAFLFSGPEDFGICCGGYGFRPASRCPGGRRRARHGGAGHFRAALSRYRSRGCEGGYPGVRGERERLLACAMCRAGDEVRPADFPSEVPGRRGAGELIRTRPTRTTLGYERQEPTIQRSVGGGAGG